MASLIKRANGSREIQIVDLDKKRQSIRLGKCSDNAAASAKRAIEDLLTSAKLDESPSDRTRRWLLAIDKKIVDRLASLGLTESREIPFLGSFTDRYIEDRVCANDTKRKLKGTRSYLIEKFGDAHDMRKTTPADAEDFVSFLVTKGLARNSTIPKHTQIASQFWNRAIKEKLIEDNPFDGFKKTVKKNPNRFYQVKIAAIRRIISACPDHGWRLVFGLSRLAGLRCPSELRHLQLSRIDWENRRMNVFSPKLKPYGLEWRWVPIVDELEPLLLDSIDMMLDGETHILPKKLRENKNLSTTAKKIVVRAGEQVWPNFFNNMRASFATDMLKIAPDYQVGRWTGDDPRTLRNFYAMVDTDDILLAIKGFADHHSKAEEVPQQNPQQSPRELEGTEETVESESPGISGVVSICHTVGVGDEGLEPPTSSV